MTSSATPIVAGRLPFRLSNPLLRDSKRIFAAARSQGSYRMRRDRIYNRRGATGKSAQGSEAVANDVTIRLLGAAAAWRGEEQLTFKTRKALAVLAYLAAAARPQRRHDLAAMFWPGRDPDRARTSLRTTLGFLRRTLGDAAGASLETTRHTVGLTPSSSLMIDIKTLDRARLLATRIASAPGLVRQLERAAAEYRGPFLADLTLPDVPEFDAWVQSERTRWLNALSTVLDRLSALQEAGGNTPAALRTLERRVAIDLGAEVAWQRLILIQSESGDTSGARRTWEACRRALAGLGRQPGGEILALVRRIPVAPSAGLAPASAVALGRSTTPATAAISGQPARFEPGLVPVLGREREVAQLQFTYEQARAGSTRLMLLEGEAGIGKSFLARKYLAWVVHSQGADVVAGRAFQTGRLPPYAAVVEPLRERLEHENAPEDLVDDVWLAELAVLLPELPASAP